MNIKEAVLELVKKDTHYHSAVVHGLYNALEHVPEENHAEILVNALEELIAANKWQLELILKHLEMHPYPIRQF